MRLEAGYRELRATQRALDSARQQLQGCQEELALKNEALLQQQRAGKSLSRLSESTADRAP
jgi:hypothetical protein